MDSVVRAVFTYVFLLLIFRIAGKRTLASITTFDLVLTLIISEAVQQALIGTDNSITNAFLLVVTLVGLDIVLSLLKQRSHVVERFLDGAPLILIRKGKVLKDRLDKERVDEQDILTAARKLHGLERIDQIKHAVLEPSGEITIIAKPSAEK